MVGFVIYLVSLLHPFHVSVTEIKFKEQQNSLQLTTRFFLDDFETALKAYTQNNHLEIGSKEGWQALQPSIKSYLQENIKLSNRKGSLSLLYVGAEIEDDLVWTYIEVLKIKKLTTLRVENMVLTEVFENQENLVHFTAFEEVKSARLHLDMSSYLFEWKRP